MQGPNLDHTLHRTKSDRVGLFIDAAARCSENHFKFSLTTYLMTMFDILRTLEVQDIFDNEDQGSCLLNYVLACRASSKIFLGHLQEVHQVAVPHFR